MNLLEQYQQQNPAAFRPKPRQTADEYGREYSGMVAMVISLSGGRIQNSRQALWILSACAGVAAIISLFLFFHQSSGTLQPKEKAFLNQGKNPEFYDKTLFPQ